MSKERSGYMPPPSELILAAQDEFGSLRLLLAQRRLYSQAKFWAFLRTVGLAVVAVLAPIVTAISPDLSIIAGAVAGLWIFLSRAVFQTIERRIAERAATIQEMFDVRVFGMPELAAREVTIMPEEIARLVGEDAAAGKAIDRESLRSWYPVDTLLDGGHAIAIAQRANAAYAERLLWWNASSWLVVTIGWALVSVALAIGLGFTLATFLLGVALPVLPALLDTFDQWRHVRGAGKERRALADQIAAELRDPEQKHVDPQQLLVWQEQLFGLRRDAPQIPNLLYRALRARNERVMSAVADELSKLVKAKGGS